VAAQLERENELGQVATASVVRDATH